MARVLTASRVRVPCRPRSGCSTAFMIVTGVVLLLPGLCALIYGLSLVYWTSGPYFPLFLIGVLAC